MYSDTFSCGYFKATRSQEAMELIRRRPNAFLLAYIIAHRARWTDRYNADDLVRGEAMLGDHDCYGMTRQEYRTGLKILRKHKFVATRKTSKGTIARLLDTRLFDPLNIESNQHLNQGATTKPPAANQQPTTNEEGKKAKKGNNFESLKPLDENVSEKIELMQQCRTLFGEAEMKNCHARWLKRAEQDPEKLRRVLADTRVAQQEHGLDNPAAYAERSWREFFSTSAQNSPAATKTVKQNSKVEIPKPDHECITRV